MAGFSSEFLGGEGLGLTGGMNKQTQRTSLDPTTRALNNYRLGLMLNSPMGASEAFGYPGDIYNLSGNSQALLGNYLNRTQQPALDPQSWYERALSGTDATAERQFLGGLNEGTRGDLNTILNSRLGYGQDVFGGLFQNELGFTRGSLDNQLQGQLGYINNTIAPQLLGAGQNYFQNIMGPQIGNEFALQGLARSGGRQEAEARGAASIALPISQTLASLQGGALSDYAGNLAAANSTAFGRYGANLGSVINPAYSDYASGVFQSDLANRAAQQQYGINQLSQIFGLNQQYPNVALGAGEFDLGRLLGGFNASDYGRQLQQGGFEGAAGRFLSAFNATPYTPATSIRGTSTNNQGLFNTSVMGTAGSGAGAAIASDRRVKKNITEADTQDFLNTLTPYAWEYINPAKHGHGTHIGVMAQDLLRSELGQQFVKSDAEGVLYVDYLAMTSTLLTCILNLHTRLQEVEHGSR